MPDPEAVLDGEWFTPEPAAAPPALRPQSTGTVSRTYVTTTERDRLAGEWLAGFRSPNTREGYRRDIREFFAWLDAGPGGEPLPFEMATRGHLNVYADWVGGEQHPVFARRGRVLQPASIARRIASISSFYRYAMDERDYITQNPAVRVRRPTVDAESLTEGLTVDEARRMMEVAEGKGTRDAAIVRLLLTTGMRVSELVNANTGDLSTERGHRTILITRKGGKRVKLPLPPSAGRAIDRHVRQRRGPLFLQVQSSERITRQAVWAVVRRCARDAQIAKAIHPHSLRHTAATLALEAGEPIHQVQDMMGHADPKTTMRYNRARLQLDDSSVHALERVLGDGGPT